MKTPPSSAATFLASYPDVEHMPVGSCPEYAFIGRSNVGKSSLINCLLGCHQLARTSTTPGKTTLLNCFDVQDNAWRIVDMPGYGWARVSKWQRRRMRETNEHYLLRRAQLVCLFTLIDIRHSLQAIDEAFLHWLGTHAIPFVLVFTKVDKLNQREKKRQIAAFHKAIATRWSPLPTMFFTSAVTREGKQSLLDFIGKMNQSQHAIENNA